MQVLHTGSHPVVMIKDSGPGHQHVGSSRHSEQSGGRVDATVELQFAAAIDLLSSGFLSLEYLLAQAGEITNFSPESRLS